MSSTIRVIYLYIFWFLFIYSSKTNFGWTTPVLAIFIIYIDKYFFYPKDSIKKVTLFTVLTLGFGLILDNLLIKLGHMSFGPSNFSPPYMWAIWLIFVPYFQFAFNRFYNQLIISSVMAGVFAPISYRGGTEIADLNISGTKGMVAIGIGWAIVFPALVVIHRKLFFNKAEQSLPQ